MLAYSPCLACHSGLTQRMQQDEEVRVKMREGLATTLDTAQQEIHSSAAPGQADTEAFDAQDVAAKVEKALFKLAGTSLHGIGPALVCADLRQTH